MLLYRNVLIYYIFSLKLIVKQYRLIKFDVTLNLHLKLRDMSSTV